MVLEYAQLQLTESRKFVPGGDGSGSLLCLFPEL